MVETRQPTGYSNRAKRAAFLGAFLGWVFDYYEIFLLTLLIVPISETFDLSAGQGAGIVSVSLVFVAVGGVLFGVIGDRIGRRRVLLITLLLFTLATFARALAPNYETLLVLTAIAGIGLGGEYGVGQALVSEVLGAKRRGWWSGLLYSGSLYAIMIAALVGGYLTPAIGWRWTFAVSGLPVLLVIYIRAKTPESPVWESTDTSSIPWRQFRTRTFVVPFLKCLVLASLYFCAYYGATSLLPKYLVSNGFSAAQASWWIFFTAVAGLLGCMAASWATDVWGRRLTFTCLMVCSTAGTVTLIISGTDLTGSLWVLVPFFVMYFGSVGAVFGSLFSESFPTAMRATGVSAALQLARGVAALPPLVAAFAIANAGYTPVFVLAAVLYVCAGAWVWVLPERKAVPIEVVDAHADQVPPPTAEAARQP